MFDPDTVHSNTDDTDDLEVAGRFTEDGLTHMAQFARDRYGNIQDVGIDHNTIIVAVDGACRGNGTHHARGAIGVFYGEDQDRRYNISRLLSGPAPTNQRAELEAARAALERALGITRNLPHLRQIIVKSDSDYLVQGMTRWILRWRETDYHDNRGRQVVNGSLFRMLDDLVLQLNHCGVEVLFWHVLRAGNREADRLANRALDAAGVM